MFAFAASRFGARQLPSRMPMVNRPVGVSFTPTQGVHIPRSAGLVEKVATKPSTAKIVDGAAASGVVPALRSQFSTVAAEAEQRYAKPLQYVHWLMGGSVMGCIGFVLTAQNVEDKGTKGTMMMLHKSCGLLTAGLLLPRIALRLSTKIPALPAGPMWEHYAAHASHGLMYAGMTGLAGSGIAMGYFGGKGLPFFGLTIPGKAEPVGVIAKNAFFVHKKMGQVMEYLVPLHVGAVGFHAVRGTNVLTRMVPASAAAAAK